MTATAELELVQPKAAPWAGDKLPPNSLDAMRLAMAVLVIFSHSYSLTRYKASEPLIALSGGWYDFGSLAVDVFFIISGFLIAMSWERSRSAMAYLRKRAARIFPGFIVAAILCACLTPLVSSSWSPLGIIAPLLHSAATLRQFKPDGVFPSNPVPDYINGSTWTIGYEFWCYLAIMVAGAVRLLRFRWLLVCLFIPLWLMFARHREIPIPQVFQDVAVEGACWVRFGTVFATGTIFYLYRRHIPAHWLLAATAAVILLATTILLPVRLTLVLPPCLGYLVFWTAFHPAVRIPMRYGDFSYGTYLYAFPIQQLIVWWWGTVSPLVMFLIAAPLAVGAGAASWHGVEKRFLLRKHG
jgi:peptidoglycan/LPS O-acetylase OafA/YrhL